MATRWTDVFLLWSKLSINEKKEAAVLLLTELHYCDCCLRHQLGKPAIYKKLVPICTSYDHNYSRDCECDCRHAARHICRECEN